MNLHKSDIDWCTHTWNPVTGCLHGCEYCYARRFIGRFQPHACERPMPNEETVLAQKDAPGCYVMWRAVRLVDETGAYVRSTAYPMGFAPTFHTDTLKYPENCLTPARIFVSSMGDLFGKWVPENWIEEVFDACKKAPQHTYLFLTKNPGRYISMAYAGTLPRDKNLWYGSTITAPNMPFFTWEGCNSFLSIEPLLQPLRVEDMGDGNPFEHIGWVIIGAMTGPGSKKHQPKREWVETIVQVAREAGAPIFMKENLRDVWGPDLIQEYPEGMVPDNAKGPAPVPHCKECEHREETPQGKRGTAIACRIGWHDDGAARPVSGRYSRSSPPWCPKRKE